MAKTTTKNRFERLLRRTRRGLPYWHGTCTLDHWTEESAARCQRTT